MSVELKIKAKHLALEPAIIRKEEQKILKRIRSKKNYQDHEGLAKLEGLYYSLSQHRKTVVRNASRATHLARAFIAGTPYKKVERKRESEFLFKVTILPEVFRMVAKYGVNPIFKKYNRETKMTDYDLAEKETLMKAIEEWSKLD